ncbi:deoxyribonuclease V [Pedobacter sp. HMF7647]|uniref:Endonuclease V n=1 Tax=Hufsiella arboris TaxID=2695275 RepID=A0A7K1YD79_9SPHI|nr:deoxyribonuclease V [Hufsiella arboris]MXV52321.1 deoxyribonuclease V [Hufsiella arboris]
MRPSEYETLRPEQAIDFQQELRKKICIQHLSTEIRLVGAADVSFNKYSDDIFAVVVILSYPDMKILEKVSIKTATKFPYISGLLAFREVPAVYDAWMQLQLKPDVMILDGQGIAHERRTGIAVHFGLLANVPTIGCAKSRLSGRYEEPGNKQFDESPMLDKNEIIGTALRTKPNCKPVFVSPGHKIDLKQSIELIKTCVRKHRIPEPTRLAHLLVNEFRKGFEKDSSIQHSLF